MNFLRLIIPDNRNRTQLSLMVMGAIILLFYSLVLTFAPVVRTLSWATPVKWEHWVGFAVWVLLTAFVHYTSSRYLPRRDPYLLPIVYSLSGLGILSIFRLSVPFGFRQVIWFSICSLLLVMGMRFPAIISLLRRYKYIWLTTGILATALTFFFGIYPGGEGPHLWLGCCGVYFQPSEPLKLLFIIYLAAFFADNWALRKNLSILIMPALIMVGAAFLVLFAQRDLGTASIFLVIFTGFIFIVIGKKRIVGILFLLISIAAYFGFHEFSVIKTRISGWLNPWADPMGGSYQIIQSLQAIASGHILGTGPGMGSPGLVPVAVSDFIYSAIAEELGLIGSFFILSMFAYLAYRGFIISIFNPNRFQKLLAYGITIYFSIQSILIIAGNIRLLPLTGVTLPFLSYGGSSLLTAFIAILFLMIISQNPAAQSISRTETKPYLLAYAAILVGFFSIATVNVNWSVVNSEHLLSRDDNFRKSINDRYVPRGDLLDRNNQPLLITDGVRGSYERLLLEPSLSTTLGYNHPSLGQSGLEASMDPYLRGMAGYPSSTVILNKLLYARPPDGLNIRSTIDMNKQKGIADLLSDQKGAAVILNAQTGEILSLWSSPGFRLAQLDEEWDLLRNSPDAPLMNRVSQGQYEIGSLAGLFSYTYLISQPARISEADYIGGGYCANPIENLEHNNLLKSLMNGCDSAWKFVSDQLTMEDAGQIVDLFGWQETYPFDLPVAITEINPDLSPSDLGNIKLTPLQVARSAAVYSNAGAIPYPHIAQAVQTEQNGWVIFPHQTNRKTIDPIIARLVASSFDRKDLPTWEFSARTQSETSKIIWYLSGTQPDWQANPYVLVLVIEDGSAQETLRLGRSVMEFFLTTSLGQ